MCSVRVGNGEGNRAWIYIRYKVCIYIMCVCVDIYVINLLFFIINISYENYKDKLVKILRIINI